MNYNDPIELTQIFRLITPQPNNEDGSTANAKTEEYAFKTSIGWEQVRRIAEYCWNDDWVTYKGPKFRMWIDGSTEAELILGDYHTFYEHWRSFRNEYPLFVHYDQTK